MTNISEILISGRAYVGFGLVKNGAFPCTLNLQDVFWRRGKTSVSFLQDKVIVIQGNELPGVESRNH